MRTAFQGRIDTGTRWTQSDKQAKTRSRAGHGGAGRGRPDHSGDDLEFEQTPAKTPSGISKNTITYGARKWRSKGPDHSGDDLESEKTSSKTPPEGP